MKTPSPFSLKDDLAAKREPEFELTVLIPVHDEEENVRPLYEKLSPVLERLGKESEIIFVDDGSTDGTFEVVKALHGQDGRVRVIGFRRNFGKAAAYSAGFQAARGSVIVTMDGDLQDDPEEIPKFLKEIEAGAELVNGWKYRGKGHWSKRIPSKIFNRVTSLLTGIRLHDFNCPFKAYTRSLAKDLHIYGELHRFIPALAHLLGYRIKEIRVENYPRVHGRSKYGAKRFLKGVLDLITVLFLLNFTRSPLYLFGSFGLLFGGAGAVINLFLLGKKIFLGTPIGEEHGPLLALGILLLVLGAQFVFMGLIGEMLTSSLRREEEKYSIRTIL